jgi:hypothetical protein
VPEFPHEGVRTGREIRAPKSKIVTHTLLENQHREVWSYTVQGVLPGDAELLQHGGVGDDHPLLDDLVAGEAEDFHAVILKDLPVGGMPIRPPGGCRSRSSGRPRGRRRPRCRPTPGGCRGRLCGSRHQLPDAFRSLDGERQARVIADVAGVEIGFDGGQVAAVKNSFGVAHDDCLMDDNLRNARTSYLEYSALGGVSSDRKQCHCSVR